MAPTIVFLHGFTHTGASWDPVIAALPERYRALAPDIRGHGSLPGEAPVTLAGVLADLAGRAPDEFTLVGYSMGGRLALHVALELTQRVRRLVLVGASPGIADPVERDARRLADDRLADEIERASIGDLAARWARTPILGGQPESVAIAAHADRLRSTPHGLARALRGLGPGALPSLWDRLAELTAPVSLVVGERDDKFRRIASSMADAIADCEIVVVAGAGHAVHLEAPQRLAEIIAGRV